MFEIIGYDFEGIPIDGYYHANMDFNEVDCTPFKKYLSVDEINQELSEFVDTYWASFSVGVEDSRFRLCDWRDVATDNLMENLVFDPAPSTWTFSELMMVYKDCVRAFEYVYDPHAFTEDNAGYFTWGTRLYSGSLVTMSCEAVAYQYLMYGAQEHRAFITNILSTNMRDWNTNYKIMKKAYKRVKSEILDG